METGLVVDFKKEENKEEDVNQYYISFMNFMLAFVCVNCFLMGIISFNVTFQKIEDGSLTNLSGNTILCLIGDSIVISSPFAVFLHFHTR